MLFFIVNVFVVVSFVVLVVVVTFDIVVSVVVVATLGSNLKISARIEILQSCKLQDMQYTRDRVQ